MDFINDVTLKDSKIDFELNSYNKFASISATCVGDLGGYVVRPTLHLDVNGCDNNILIDSEGYVDIESGNAIRNYSCRGIINAAYNGISFISDGVNYGGQINFVSNYCSSRPDKKPNINFFVSPELYLSANMAFDCNGCLSQNTVEPQVQFTLDSLNFNLPSVFSDSIQVGSMIGGGSCGCGDCVGCGCRTDGSYGLYVDSNSFTYDNGTQYIDINPLTGINVNYDDGNSCNGIHIRANAIDITPGFCSAESSHILFDKIEEINFCSARSIYFESSEIRFDINRLEENYSTHVNSYSCGSYTIRGGKKENVGYITIANKGLNARDVSKDIDIVNTYYCGCSPIGPSDHGALNLTSLHGNVNIFSSPTLSLKDGIGIVVNKYGITFDSFDKCSVDYTTFISKIPSIFENSIEFKKPVVSTDNISASEFKTDGNVSVGDKLVFVANNTNIANITTTSNSCGVSQLTINSFVNDGIVGSLAIGSCSYFNASYLTIDANVDINSTLDVSDDVQAYKNSHFCGNVYTYSDTYASGKLIANKTLNANENVSFTGSKCATSKFVSDIPATFNKKAIFNDGICTKSITSIAGTQIFDTTDGKGFNFKGLYTLNGFGTTNKPFFKQESATNNWIDVTTLKEGGTALADKYALKTDIPADVDLSNYAQKATTLAGYGIADAYTKSEIDSKNVSFLTKESSGIQTVSSDLALTGYVLIDNLSIDELEIESLTASSKVTLSGGLEVSNGLVADSIKVGSDTVALAKNIPNVSSFITKDVSNLTNYETKTAAEGKYALKTSLTSYALKTDISNVYKYVGSVNTAAELPSNLTTTDTGKVYNIVNESTSGDLKVSAGDNVAWTGSSWDKLGGSVDLSNYAQKATTLAGYGITNAYTKTEADSTFATLNLVNNNVLHTTGNKIESVTGEKFFNHGLIIGAGDFEVIPGIGPIVNSVRGVKITNINPTDTNGYSIDFVDSFNGSTIHLPSTVKYVNGNKTFISELTLATTDDVVNKADKATTLAGYGITDAYTKAEVDANNIAFLTKESSGIQTVSSDLALTGYVLIDNLAIDELNIESLTATSKVTLSGGLEVSNGLVADSIKIGNDAVALAKNIPNVSSFITKDVSNLTNYETKTVAEGKYALKTDIPDVSDVKTPIFKYFQNPVIPASCSLFAIATNAEFENMPMMQLVRNSDNKIVSADISWKSNSSGGHDIMVGIDHSAQINANTYTLQAFGY